MYFASLQSCTKVALDFVSPENIHECIRLTKEFRVLPLEHKSKEDKLEANYSIAFYPALHANFLYIGFLVLTFLVHACYSLHIHALNKYYEILLFLHRVTASMLNKCKKRRMTK